MSTATRSMATPAARPWLRPSPPWSSPTAFLTTTASGPCKAATWPTMAGMCWPSTCRAMAAALALRPPRSRRGRTSCWRCWTQWARCRAAWARRAFRMKVGAALMAAALDDPHQALRMVNLLSRSTLAASPSALGPGTWVFGASMALGRKLLRNHSAVNLFHRGLLACDSYANGAAAIAQLRCPVLFALGAQDRMTPPQAAQGLILAAQAAGQRVQIAHLPVGHHPMTEAPEETLCALRAFLAG